MNSGDQPNQIRILLLEDDPADAELTEYALRDGELEFQLERVDSEEAFLAALEETPPDIILSDYSLPSFDGFHALTLTQQKTPEIPFIFVTGTLGEEVAIETLKSGATDYVLKTRLNRLASAVQRALREARERSDRKRAESQLRESHEQLRALSIYLQYVREEERTRIAREVHDELGQALTGLKMDLSWLMNRFPKDAQPLIEKTKQMSGHIDATIQTVRRISTELRPGVLDDLGLGAAIEWQANEFQTRTEIRCHVRNDLMDPVLDQDLNTTFFRIFQETLTNVMRHAEASRVDVHLWQEDGKVLLRVRDNGRGIKPENMNNRKSIGLLGMKERAALLGGEVQVKGKSGHGTTVLVSIPVRSVDGGLKPDHENTYRRRPRSSPPRVEANIS